MKRLRSCTCLCDNVIGQFATVRSGSAGMGLLRAIPLCHDDDFLRQVFD